MPEPFWYISLLFQRNGLNVDFLWQRNHLFDKLAVLVFYKRCLQHDQARVASVIRKSTSNWRPLPLTTVELQKTGSRVLGLSSHRIMDVAEKLYQKGFISYPRTETNQFPIEMDLRALVEKQVPDSRWGHYAQGLVGGGFRPPRRGIKDDKAHPPIHPIVHVNIDGLENRDERTIYEFVTRTFLACCSEDAKGERTTVALDWNGERFTAIGLVISERNYLEVFPYTDWRGTQLPAFTQGEMITPTSSKLQEGKTSAPNYLTEPGLIALMDANGIGTDATIADHIKRVIDRRYVEQRANGRLKELVPTTLGTALIEAYDAMSFEESLGKPYLRKKTEQQMTEICNGQRNKADVVRESIEQYRDVFMKASQEKHVLVNTVRQFFTPT